MLGHRGLLSVSQASWRSSDHILHFCCLLQLLPGASFCLIGLKYAIVAVALKIPQVLCKCISELACLREKIVFSFSCPRAYLNESRSVTQSFVLIK